MKRNYHCKDCKDRYVGCHGKCDKYEHKDPYDDKQRKTQEWYDYTLKRKW